VPAHTSVVTAPQVRGVEGRGPAAAPARLILPSLVMYTWCFCVMFSTCAARRGSAHAPVAHGPATDLHA